MNLGMVLTLHGQQRKAVVHLKRALSLAPGNAMLRDDAAASFLNLGRWDLALPLLEQSLATDPRNAKTLASLAFLHFENGRRAEALAAASRAVEAQPSLAWAHFLVHRVLYDDRNVAASLPALKEAVRCEPQSVWYRFMLGVLLDQNGDPKGSKELFDGLNGACAGGIDAWSYVKAKRTAATRIFASTRETLHAGFDAARPDGLTLELGVRYGISTRWLAERCDLVHGFDSFAGLPEQWHIQAKGTYSTHGDTPEVPANVKLHVGWFDATLPGFLKEHAEPVRLVNVDCDLYSSTKTVLDQLASRIGAGSVLVFDEYIVNDRWREDEFKAFQEAVAEHRWRYEYLAFSIADYQAAVRIL
jgi:cytochrome c-type biogenesis protein CcmH/NrfG